MSRTSGRPLGRVGLGGWGASEWVGLPSFQMYQSAWELVRELAESRNQGCLSEVWLSTMWSRLTMWWAWAAASRPSKSARVPYFGSMVVYSGMSYPKPSWGEGYM